MSVAPTLLPLLRTILLFGTLITLTQQGVAQVTVTGTISDAVTGETLPAANIRVSGTYTGTISNADGAFRIVLSSVPATIVFRYIGYHSDSLLVIGTLTAPLKVQLQPSVLEMNELVVTDENRAIELMSRVIARKKRMRAVLENYRVDAYNRFTLANDTGVVAVVETVTEAYWDKEKGSREIVKMERKTSNFDFSGLPAAMLVSNLYNDNIEISGFEFVGVTNPRALSVYDYEIVGTRLRDDQLVYDISVAPKAGSAVAFVGTITVLDREAVLLSADLKPGSAFRFPPPIQEMKVAMSQQYDVFGDSLWLPVDFRSTSTIRFGIGGVFEIPRIQIDQVSRLQKYEVNTVLPELLYASVSKGNDQRVTMDTLSVKANPQIPDSLSVPLRRLEARAYETIDSTDTMAKAYQPTGMLARFVNLDFSVNGERDSDREETGRSKITPSAEPILLYNRVDGLKFGARPSLTYGPAKLSAGIAYSTALDADPWSTDVGLVFGRSVEFGFRWFDQSDQTFRSPSHPPILNSASLLIGGTDYFDYYRRSGIEASLGFDVHDLVGRVGFLRERHDPLEARVSYDLLGSKTLQPPNEAIMTGDLRSFTGQFAINPQDNPVMLTGSRSLYVDIEVAPAIFESDFEFASAAVRVDWTHPTFARRRLLPATLDLRFEASTFTGSIPPQRLAVLDVSNCPFSTYGTMRAAQKRPFRGEEKLALFWEHNFRTIPFELIGLGRLADRNYGIVLFGGHGATRIQGLVQSHHEIGISLTGILGALRLDAAKRLDGNGYGIGFGIARLF